MIYEVRSYTLKPGTVADCEQRFAEAIAHREKYSPLGAFWHTEVGPLNQIIHVWPYENLQQRTEIRAQAMKDPHWPPKILDMVESMESEIFIPAPFMQPLGKRKLGNVHEMRTYMYKPGSMPEVLARWAEAIPQRVQISPLAACWYSDVRLSRSCSRAACSTTWSNCGFFQPLRRNDGRVESKSELKLEYGSKKSLSWMKRIRS